MEKRHRKYVLGKSRFVVINIHLKAEYPQGDLGRIEGIFCLHSCVHLEQCNPEQSSSLSLPLNTNEIEIQFPKEISKCADG